MTGFDNGFVLLRSVNTVSVVMFCAGEMGMLELVIGNLVEQYEANMATRSKIRLKTP